MSVFREGDPYGQLKLPSDLGRAVLRGEILIRDPANYYEGNLPGATSDRVFGVIAEEAGGEAGQNLPLRLLRRGEIQVRIQDSATIALYSLIQPSSTDAGAAVAFDGTGVPFGRVLEAITSGTTDQYALAEIWCDGPAPAGVVSASFAFTAAAANVAEVLIKMLDASGKAIAAPWVNDIFLSDAATGAGLTGTTTSGTVTAKAASGAVFSTYTAKKDLRCQALATGSFTLEITDSAKTAFYVVVRGPGGVPFVSRVMATADYGS